ncbi:hypothetical protein SUFG_00066 [Sulfitobacter phage phiCB2047-B]|uniref:Uncharacterized protein n=1 Tax=Sulfitobacter phage phiCB2047-B TaxID=754046 RepID=M4PN15_9CAUD|nr:hypothetical protein SUFG_00066 [Sulfitobacter phage phiCB2047-B]AGH07433.1 hypothetical protein SUFG_00066 [Sulfitobacter phage phiCB2047-B]
MAFKLKQKNTRRTANTTVAATREEDEFAGLWINVGVVTEQDGEDGEESVPHFNRVPRGIAVSDLEEHRIYAQTHERNPDWAAEAKLVNQIIRLIRKKGLELDEGESTPLNLSVQLYRRQEQVSSVDADDTEVDDEELENTLFG